MSDKNTKNKVGTAMNIDSDALAYFMIKYNHDYDNIEANAKDNFNNYVDKGLSDILYCVTDAIPCDFDNYRGTKYLRRY